MHGNMDCIVVHYGEIGTKGKNRGFFERKLVENIEKTTGMKAEREYGRIIVEAGARGIEDVLGVAFFSPALKAELKIKDIKNKALALAKKNKAGTFAVSTTRQNKKFELNSKQINEAVGEHIRKNTGMKVDLSNPEKTIFIEITQRNAYIYGEKIRGHGGLPVGVSGKAVSLLSGGIDSPVASYLMMKRGCRVVYVHFHNFTSRIEEKIEKIVRHLNKFQHESTVYMIPFFPIQEKIIEKVDEKYRMIVYRRMMFRIAERIMETEKAGAIITGDNLAQVASQTIENLHVIHAATSGTVLSPLIGMDKNDIINIAKKIGTYEASIEPYPDCCSYMIARHPATRSNMAVVEDAESGLQINDLVDYGVGHAEVKKIGAKQKEKIVM